MELVTALPGGEWAMPAYFNGQLYYGGANSQIQAFTFSPALLAMMLSSVSSETYRYPGTSPSISANGTNNAILWAVQNTSTNNRSIGVLRANDATNLATELYNSATVTADISGIKS